MSKKKAKLFCKETKIKDLKLFYLWVNDPLVRRNALNTKSISWNSHQKWFKKKIKDKKAKLYIFKNKKIEVGQERFEKKKICHNKLFSL